jgi:hypothetical protein
MNKISLYYMMLIGVVVVQFVSSVIGKSLLVQQSVTIVDEQRELASYEQRETDLIHSLAAKTSLQSIAVSSGEYVAISQPVAVLPTSQVAAR